MLKQRVLVVDDDKEVARLMRGYLEQSGYEVLVAYNGESAIHIMRRDNPDLVLLDLMLPDRDGWDVTRTVRNDPNLMHTPIIMLTARVSDTDKIVGLELGADDYVTKPYNPREVVARVRARLRVQTGRPGTGSSLAFQNKILRVGGLQMDIGRHEILVEGRPGFLTATEFEILRVMMEQSGYVLTRSELIRKAFGDEFLGIERTLDSHIRNLRQKIEPDPKNPQYIKTVYGVGYRLEAGDAP
jgi:two-component system alkaline phosphatase synthesis response regulator PhoP